MAEYHKYVFNSEDRVFIGDFQKMYQQEAVCNFDSWHQDDSRQLNRMIALDILSNYNFHRIVDIGSGKGSLTHRLKRLNNEVLGIDISSTACDIARSRFPDIEFCDFDVNNPHFIDFLDRKYGVLASRDGGVDLVFCAELLSYVSRWKRLLEDLSFRTKYLLINLYIPENPIGFVESSDELVKYVEKHFHIIECIQLTKSRFTIIFAISCHFPVQ